MKTEKDVSHGGYPDRPDPRDFIYGQEELGHAAVPFNWSLGVDVEQKLGIKPPTKDQGQAGSCGGEAESYYSANLEYALTKSFEERSAHFVYALTYYPNGGGTAMRDLVKLYQNTGIARESMFTSYMNGNAPTEAFMRSQVGMTPEVFADAKNNLALSYATVPAAIELFAQAIRDNNGMVFGVSGHDNGTWLSATPQPPKKTDTGNWGHWLYGVGAEMKDGKKAIKFHNSWGASGVGEGGYQWLTEDYFNAGFVWPGWTFLINDAPVTPTPYHFTKQMDMGSQNEDVRQLQVKLQALGYFPVGVTPTKYYGKITRGAVEKYQCAKGIICSGTAASTGFGRVGPGTLAALNS